MSADRLLVNTWKSEAQQRVAKSRCICQQPGQL